MKSKHPMQPVVRSSDGVIRFKANAIVQHLIDWGHGHGHGLNELSLMRFSKADWTQLAQLIGYSVSGAGDLDYFDRVVLADADEAAATLRARRKRKRPLPPATAPKSPSTPQPTKEPK